MTKHFEYPTIKAIKANAKDIISTSSMSNGKSMTLIEQIRELPKSKGIIR